MKPNIILERGELIDQGIEAVGHTSSVQAAAILFGYFFDLTPNAGAIMAAEFLREEDQKASFRLPDSRSLLVTYEDGDWFFYATA